MCLRTKGNEYYKAKNFTEALRAYNLSLCFSPVGSVEYYQSLANRSALFYQQRQFQRCQSDLLLVFESSVDDGRIHQLQEKLQSRLDRCLAELREKNGEEWKEELEKPLKYFQLKNPNPAVPSAEDTVKVETSQSRGRHVITKKFIPPGITLAIQITIGMLINLSCTISILCKIFVLMAFRDCAGGGRSICKSITSTAAVGCQSLSYVFGENY